MEEHPNSPYTSPDLGDLVSSPFCPMLHLIPFRSIAIKRIDLPSLFIRVFEIDTWKKQFFHIPGRDL